MAPYVGQTQAVAAEAWEAKLAEKAASRLAASVPWRPQPRIAKELLAGLLEAKQARQQAGLDHWSENAPTCLEELARQFQVEEQARRLRVEEFIKRGRDEAVKLALAITDNLANAEAVVADTELELLQGALREELYFLGIKRNALNLLKRLQSEQEATVPLEEAFQDSDADGEGGLNGEARLERLEATSGWRRLDELDPLEAILHRQEQRQLTKELRVGMELVLTVRKYRWIRQRKWWKKLELRAKMRPKSGSEMPPSPDY